MKPIYFLAGLLTAISIASCSDDEKAAVPFEITKLSDKNTMEMTMKRDSLFAIVSAPGPWKCTEKPDWVQVYPSEASGSADVKFVCEANEGKIRKGTLTLACGTEVRTIEFGQDGYIIKGFPVEWLFTTEYSVSGKYTSAFVDDNALPAEIGEGTISYIQDPANTRPIVKVIGGTGHPYLSGSLTNDYWLFRVPVKERVPAGAVFHIKFQTRSSKTAARYWSLEYLDGGEWKPLAAQRTAEVAGEKVVYTLDLVEDLTGNKKVGTDNAQVDNDFTLSAPIEMGGELQVRLRCVHNIATGGANPNTGNHRLAGAVGTSPVISVLSAD